MGDDSLAVLFEMARLRLHAESANFFIGDEIPLDLTLVRRVVSILISMSISGDELTSHLGLLWLCAALVFLIVEVGLPSFGFIFLATSAAITAFFSRWTPGWERQMIVFAGAVILNLALIRPFWMKKFAGAKGVPSRTEVLIGLEGTLTEDLDPLKGSGRLLVEGQDWAAAGSVPLKKGDRVIVESADGIVLIVSKIERK